jgi:hypothetical protein
VAPIPFLTYQFSSLLQHTEMLIAITMLGLLRNGIVAVHAISGVVMIVRDTDFLRREKQIEKETGTGTEGR